MKILSGHYSPETAYTVDDYPYGFKLRCMIRYWLEVNVKGTRMWSQTTNPKKGNAWNKAKASTYCLMGAMYLDGKGHTQWSGLSIYDASKTREFLDTYREGLTTEQIAFAEKLASAHEAREARKASAESDAR